MAAKLHIESLSKEYRKKLCSRQLTRATIDSLAGQISRKYQELKRGFRLAAILCTAITLLLPVLTLFSPNAASADPAALLFAFFVSAVIEVLVLIFAYFAVLTRVPRQFDRCLRQGYPELSMLYGYEMLVNGSLTEKKPSQQLPFSLCIEEIFPLKDSQDLVVAGYGHGLITKGYSVYIMDKDDPSRHGTAALVTRIEKAPQKPAALAADCTMALQIKNGKQLGLKPGMYLYREESSV